MTHTIQLNLIQTVALAAFLCFFGEKLLDRIFILRRYNIPAAVIGGLIFAAVAALLQWQHLVLFHYDTNLQNPLMIAFFTTIGLSASLKLLKQGGPQVVQLLILSSLIAVLQNGMGVLVAKGLDVHPLLGIICGSVTLMGGPATGAAFGQQIEQQYGMNGAIPMALAAASFGIIVSGLLGGATGSRLIRKHRFGPATGIRREFLKNLETCDPQKPIKGELNARSIMEILLFILGLMWGGGIIGSWAGKYFTMPAYIGSMVLAAIMRNINDHYLWVQLSDRIVNRIGSICLALFLAMLLMTLPLQNLFQLMAPMLIILCLQTLLMVLLAYWITFRWMGGDYDAAIMVAGHVGFGLGTTANAVANMEALTDRYGPAPRAFLVLPIVGAFFIDFTNSLIISAFIHWVA